MGLCLVAHCLRDARHRYACEHCRERMRRELREIDTYHAIIKATKDSGRRGLSERRAPGFTSQVPGRTDAIVADDIRSRSTGDGPDDEDGAVRSLLGTLHGIARWVRAEQDVSEPLGYLDVSREIGWLLPQIEWCSTQQWAGELAADIHELHHEARRIAGDSPPRPVGPCLNPDCSGTVYPALIIAPRDPAGPRIEGGRCSRCDYAYDWVEVIKIRRRTT